MLRYWNKQGRFPASANGNIDWDVVKYARASLPFDRRTWMVKQVSDFCGTGEKMRLWQYRKDNACPLCNEPENSLHVIKCSSGQANQQWRLSIKELKAHLADNDTPSSTVNVIVQYLQSWRDTDYETNNKIIIN